jgi:hypothetical protein
MIALDHEQALAGTRPKAGTSFMLVCIQTVGESCAKRTSSRCESLCREESLMR